MGGGHFSLTDTHYSVAKLVDQLSGTNQPHFTQFTLKSTYPCYDSCSDHRSVAAGSKHAGYSASTRAISPPLRGKCDYLMAMQLVGTVSFRQGDTPMAERLNAQHGEVSLCLTIVHGPGLIAVVDCSRSWCQ